MPSLRREYHARRALGAAVMALGLAALAGPSALSGDADGGKGGVPGVASSPDAAVRGEATGGLGLTGEPARGESAFAMSATDVTESFFSLTQQQQARVMQRCREVIAKPAQSDPNHIAVCQTLAAATKR